MDFQTLIPQLGIATVFAGAALKLYNDMRQDSLRREEQIRQDSKEREQKLMEHLDQNSDVMKDISHTLENINSRLTIVENNVCTRDREES